MVSFLNKYLIGPSYLKSSKKSKLHIDELIYKEAKNTVQRLIKKKKKKIFSEKLEENIGEPKNFGKTLKNLALIKQRLKVFLFSFHC